MKTVVLLLIGVAFTQGCSAIFVNPPPEGYDGRAPLDCTTNQAAPVIDTLLAVTTVGGVMFTGGPDHVDKTLLVSGTLFMGAIWVISAIHGYEGTRECKEALAYSRRGSSTPSPPSPVPPPGVPQPVTPAPVSPPAQVVPPPPAAPEYRPTFSQ